MKNLLLLVPSLEGGGQERIAAETSRLLEDDYQLFFAVFNSKGAKYEISRQAVFWDLDIPSSNHPLQKLLNVLRRVRKLRKLKHAHHIDISFSFGRTANLVNCLSKKKDKIICSVRNSSRLETGEKNMINTLFVKKADHLLYVSEGQRQQALKTYPQIAQKSSVIYNPCNTARIAELCANDADHTELPLTLATCGRLEEVKCHINLFHAFQIVRNRFPDLRLIVFGEGRKRKELEEYLLQHGLSEHITLAGFSANPFSTLHRCSAFVFSSGSESFGNVITEALACGLPVISTDCCYGPREILADNADYSLKDHYEIVKYGILTPAFTAGIDSQPAAEKIFADAITELLTNQPLADALREKAVPRSRDFSVESYRRQLLDLIESCTSAS